MERSGRRGAKCSYCTEQKKRCVAVSWEVLETTRKRVQGELEQALDNLESAQAKVNRLRKVLKLAEERSDTKAMCLLDELQEEDEAAPDPSDSVVSFPEGFAPSDVHDLASLSAEEISRWLGDGGTSPTVPDMR